MNARRKLLKILQVLTSVLVLSIAGSSVAGALYSWRDSDGKLHITDRPPSSQVTSGEKVEKVITYSDAPAIPQSSGKHDRDRKPEKSGSRKVTIYTASWCGYCDKARAYLKRKRVPFTEYDIERSVKGRQDYDRLNGRGVPLILVGNQRMSGFNEGRLERMLQ